MNSTSRISNVCPRIVRASPRSAASLSTKEFSRSLRGLLIVAFAILSGSATAKGTPASTPQEASEIFRAVSPSVVVVHAMNAAGQEFLLGSGVVVAEGLVATNAHVVKNAHEIKLSQSSRTWSVSSVAVDSDRDLALLRVADFDLPAPSLGSIWEVAVGNKVYAIGAPEGLEATLSDGIVSGLRGSGADTVIQITAAISPGSSGGGVFDDHGRLIGLSALMLTGGQNLNFALPIDWVMRLTEKLGSTVGGGKKLGAPEAEPSGRFEASIGGEGEAWKASLAQVEAQYPGGYADRFGTGETFYRVAEPGFGMRSVLISFCIRPGYGLAAVFVEFPDAGSKLDIRHGEYVRLPVDRTGHLYEAIIRRITARFGSPTVQDGTATEGGIVVWKPAHDTFVRLTSVPIDAGRVHMALRVADASDKSQDPTEEKNLEAGLWKTTPSSWSDGGAFSLRWGMGPGDVLALYPNLDSLWSSGDEPVRTYRSDVEVEGSVGAYFAFYRGRLVSLDISPFSRSSNAGSKKSDAELQAYWLQCDEWRERIRNLLTKKFGPPLAAPSGKDGREASDGANRQWVWRVNGTGVLLDHSTRGMPLLRFVEIASYEAVQKAEQAYDAAKEKEQKQADLPWGEAPEPTESVVQLKGPADRRLSAISPQRWSKAEWLGFRWGMGKRDVALVADDPKHPLSRGLYRSNQANLLRSGKLLGWPCNVVFYFDDRSRLYQISVRVFGEPKGGDEAGLKSSVRDWFKSAKKRMTKDYGTPECTDDNCSWSRAGRVKASLTMHVDGKDSAAELALEDPGPPVAAKPKSYWSEAGWESLRIGMSPEDATDAVGGVFPEPTFGALPAAGEDGMVTIEWPEAYLGLRVDTELSFDHGRLNLIVVRESKDHPIPQRADSLGVRRKWFQAVKEHLSTAYGSAKCSRKGEGNYCSWDKDGIVKMGLLLTVQTNEPAAQRVALVVDDPGPPPPTRADQSLLTRRTNSKTWARDGWQDLRFGMGVGDVLRRLSSKTGEIRATKPAECTVSSDWHGVVECELVETSHELEIVGRRPTLSFLFLDGRLFAADLTFYGYDTMEQAVSDYEELVRLLQSKYGSPEPGSKTTVALPEKDFSIGSANWLAHSLEVSLGATIMAHSKSAIVLQYWDGETKRKLRPIETGDRGKL
jgi:S1-C subfamily serine protease